MGAAIASTEMENKCSTVKKDERANPTVQAEDNSCNVLSEDLFAFHSRFDLSDDVLANIPMPENRLISNMNNLYPIQSLTTALSTFATRKSTF